MIETLISSKTRIKLLLKFFLNSSTTAYLRNLESEFGESTNGIRLELKKFEEAGMLSSFKKGNKKIFQANTDHPLFNEVHNIILKYVGLDKVINVVNRLGDLEQVYLLGAFSKGLNSNIIDLVFVGEIDQTYLFNIVKKAEGMISRKIRYLVYSKENFDLEQIKSEDSNPLLLWKKDQNKTENDGSNT